MLCPPSSRSAMCLKGRFAAYQNIGIEDIGVHKSPSLAGYSRKITYNIRSKATRKYIARLGIQVRGNYRKRKLSHSNKALTSSAINTNSLRYKGAVINLSAKKLEEMFYE